MKRFLAIIAILVTTIGASYSQVPYEIRQAMDFFRTNKLNSEDFNNTITQNDIQGSPYLFDEFINGTIFTTSKLQFENVPLRYNIHNDQIEFKTPQNEIQALATPEIVETVEFGEYKMVYVPYSNSKKIRYGFFRVVIEGTASLYARSEMIFKNATKPGAYKEAQPAKFINQPNSYYIRVRLDQAKKVGNKKEAIEIFPDHKDEIATFIKKNKIKTNNSESLEKLVQYYNSL